MSVRGSNEGCHNPEDRQGPRREAGPSAPPRTASAADFLAGGGEMGTLIRGQDWSASPLGPPDTWPQSLRSAVSILLPSRAQICLFWGPDLIAIYNDAYRPTLGIKHPWALGRPAREVWSEFWDDVLRPLLEQVVERGDAFWGADYPFFLERRGFPEETYFDISYDPVRDESGAVGGVFCIVSETTGRVVGERRLKTLRQISEVAAGAALADEAVRRVAEAISGNPHDVPFALFYDQRSDGHAGRCIATAGIEPVDAGRWPLAHAATETLIEADQLSQLQPLSAAPWPEPVSKVVIHRMLGGGQAPLGWLVAGVSPRLPLDEPYRDFFRLVAAHTASAVTAARALEEERERSRALAELDKAKTTFFSNVSHEFRTPLTLMLAPLEQMLGFDSGAPAGKQRELVTIAHRNAIRLQKLVNALLDFSRIEAGRMQARYEPVDLPVLTAELTSNFRSAIETAGLRLVVDCPPLAEPVFVDRGMWETVVLNLLSNAFKYTFEGEIAVRLRASEETVELHIEDTGTGIAGAELPRLFERFHRVENAKGRSFEGTGIGLALVQELVRLHGGRIAVRSAFGRGTTFTINIPTGHRHLPPEHVAHKAVGAPVGSRAQAYVSEAMGWLAGRRATAGAEGLMSAYPDLGAQVDEGRGLRVLLADDNADMREYVGRLLSGCGYDVEAVPDGQAALARALAAPPDLVLSDVMMPGLDGIGLLKALRADQRTTRVPMIVLSARAGEKAKLEGLATGADDYLIKPFSSRELIAKVAGAIRLEKARREAARTLEEENLRMRELFEQAPGFIAMLAGPDHVFQFANASYRRLVGDRALIGKAIRDALPDVDGQGYFELLDKVYASGERFVGREAPVRLQAAADAQAHDVVVDFIYEPIRGRSGHVTGILVQGYEVTGRVAAQVALHANEEQLRLATEAAEIGLWDVDIVNDTLYWPPRVKAMFGISPDVPVTMDDFHAGLHPDDRDATAAAYAAANDPERRALYDVEYRTVGKEDGVIRWVAAKGRGVFDDRGRCVRVIGTAIDVTGRKASEARLKELNETLERRMSEALAEKKLLADIVEGTDAFVQVADLDYTWLAINRASADEFERIYGVRPKVGDNMLQLLADRPTHQASVRAVWGRALAGEEFTEIAEFGDPARDRRSYEMKFNILRDKEGRRIGAYQFVYDVTDRLRDQQRLAEAEATLRQTQKLEAMGQLTGGVAHDFNNLLMPIIAGLDLLQRRGAEGERGRRWISGALQSAERARTLVHRLLAFARRQPLQPQPVDVGALIRGMAELVDSTTGPQIKVLVDVAEDLPAARADPNQLEMAILNLSVNARDAMEGGGTLRISADAQTAEPGKAGQLAPGAYVRISVADTGCGMDDAVAARAIEPFFSTKGIGKGTGLGLSMVHGLALQLGGTLTIRSRRGFGTYVELWLPVCAQPVSRTVVERGDEPARLAAGTALLVDDEDVVRMTAADMLTELGFRVVQAESGERALQMLDQGLLVDLLITDHLMSGMTGAQLAYAVRERRPAVRVLVISGFAEAEGLAPDLPRLTKPFRQTELSAALQELGLGLRQLAAAI
jgi:PAS domain S-box-containing protein